MNKSELEKKIIEKSSLDVLNYISNNFDYNSDNCQIIYSSNIFNINKSNRLNSILNLYRINDIRYLNDFFKSVNMKLNENGDFLCCVETYKQRRQRKKISKFRLFRYLYFGLEYIFMRVFPKLKITTDIYFFLTRGKNRLISKTECFGRLIYCGFDIIDSKEIDGKLYVKCLKKRAPEININPSYGPIYKMPRIGKNKKIIHVYKLRTMYPYAEFLQKDIALKNGLINGDKINNDYRISSIGKFLRRFWIDELPMLINLLKGDVKIVGVRPLSNSKFEVYPKDLQDLRTSFKPGLIPPFYADIPKSLDGLQDSERNYLNQYKKHPIITDIKYFSKAMFNIIFRGARSR